MRKHFLILMLLALLPFTTWAQGAQELQSLTNGFAFTLGTTNHVYDGTVPNFNSQVMNNNLTTPVALIYGTDYELEFYKNDQKLDAAPSAAGSYTVRCHGIGSYKDYTINDIAVTIQPATITVTIGTETDAYENWTFKKSYHAVDPVIPAVNTWTFACNAQYQGAALTTDGIKDKLTIPTTPTYVYNNTSAELDANADKTGVLLGTNATAGYPIQFPGITVKDAEAGNYNLVITPRSMKILQVELDDDGAFSFAHANRPNTEDASYTYTGVVIDDQPVVKYKWGTGDNDIYTLTSSDVVVKYYDATATEVRPRNAGVYTAKIFAAENAKNFVDPTDEPVVEPVDEPAPAPVFNPANELGAINDLGFTIKRAKSLTVLVNPISRAYNAKAFSANEAKFTISGWVDADAGTKITDLTADIDDTGDNPDAFAPGKGQYVVKLVLANEETKTFANTVVATRTDGTHFNPSDNYEIIPFGNTWTITAAPLKFAFDPTAATGKKTVTTGEVPTVDGLDFTVDGIQKVNGDPTEDDEAVKDAFKVALIDGDYANVNSNGYDAFTVVRKVAADYAAEGGDVYVQAADELLANYSYDLPADVTTKGKLFVEGVGFTIMPVASDLTYGEAFEPDYFAHRGTTQVVLAETETNKVNYIVKKGETTYPAEQWAKLPVGEYTVSIDMTNMEALVAGTNYSVGDVEAQPVTFNVSQKELTLAISDVELLVGDTQDNLQKKYPINDNVATGILAGDEEKVKFVFSFDTDKVTLNNNHLVSVANEGVGAIKIAFNTETDDKTYLNYKFPEIAPTGNLTLSNEYVLELDLASNNLLDLIHDADNNGNKYTVKFSEGTLKGQTWYTMVLPFPVKTTELVSQLKNSGNQSVFAIVNVFDATHSEKGNIKFVMEWSEVHANTPFMIKTAEDVDLSKVQFTQKYITYDETPATEADADGDQFIGTYTKKSIIHDSENHIYYGWYDSNDQKRWRQPKNNAHEMQPLEAYLKYAPGSFDGAAPVITFEDIIDGNVTAIKTFTTEGGNNDAKVKEGWYTLNGVKLQGVPTEKGVYINNGKKIVIR